MNQPPLRDSLAPQTPEGGNFRNSSIAGKKGEKSSSLSLAKPINWKAEDQLIQEVSRTEKKTRASLPKTSPKANSILHSRVSTGWLQTSLILLARDPPPEWVLPPPLPRSTTALPVSTYQRPTYPWKPSSNHCSPRIHLSSPQQEAGALLWNSESPWLNICNQLKKNTHEEGLHS